MFERVFNDVLKILESGGTPIKVLEAGDVLQGGAYLSFEGGSTSGNNLVFEFALFVAGRSLLHSSAPILPMLAHFFWLLEKHSGNPLQDIPSTLRYDGVTFRERADLLIYEMNFTLKVRSK